MNPNAILFKSNEENKQPTVTVSSSFPAFDTHTRTHKLLQSLTMAGRQRQADRVNLNSKTSLKDIYLHQQTLMA